MAFSGNIRIWRDRAAARLHTTPQAMAEYSLLVVALFLADPTRTSLVTGLTIASAGMFFRIWSAGYGYRTGQYLLQGPYRFVRHPYYLGSFLTLCGLMAASRSSLAFSAAILVLGKIVWDRMRLDESALEKSLGPAFAAYRAGVPALLPQLVPYKVSRGGPDTSPLEATPATAAEGRFSFSTAFFRGAIDGRRREIEALTGIVVGFLLMYLAYVVPAKGIFRLGLGFGVMVILTLRVLYFRGISGVSEVDAASF